MEAKERAPGRRGVERKTSGGNAREDNHENVLRADDDTAPRGIQQGIHNNSEQGRGTGAGSSTAAAGDDAKGVLNNVGGEGSFLPSHASQGATGVKPLLRGGLPHAAGVAQAETEGALATPTNRAGAE